MTNSKYPSNNNVLIIALVALASVVVAAIVALAIYGSPDNAIVASALGQIVTLVTLIAGILVTFRATTEAKVAAIESKVVAQEAVAAAVESTAASKLNAQTIAVVSVQQAHALEEQGQTLKQVDRKVDGHLSGIMQEMKQMALQIARLETDKAVKQVETAQIIAAVAAAVPGAVPPIDEGATVVTIDPPEAATITTGSPRGKLPKVGDQS